MQLATSHAPCLDRRLTSTRTHNTTKLGAFSFAFCGAYEMQGPALGWFDWPDEHQLTYPAGGATLWQLEPDPQGRGMLISDHAHAALLERAFGFPLAAPLYHIAMGIGLMQVRLRAPVPVRSFTTLTYVQ